MQSNQDQDSHRPPNAVPPEHDSAPAPASACATTWDPDAVQSLLNDAYKRGESPVVLCLGRREAAALKIYLSKFFDDDAFYLKNFVYAGLKVVALRVESLLRVETLRSIYSKSRHEEQTKIRKAIEQNRTTGSSSIPIRPPHRK